MAQISDRSTPRVLISGAGIAGLCLAYWLAKAGWSVTIVERAAQLRTGGQAIDFRGKSQLRILRQMGILDRLVQNQTRMAPIQFLGSGATPSATLSSEFAGGDVEILRGTLIQVLASVVPDSVCYRFSDSIASVQHDLGGVSVAFHSGSVGSYDILVGADGLTILICPDTSTHVPFNAIRAVTEPSARNATRVLSLDLAYSSLKHFVFQRLIVSRS